jgi:hypothetical protein
VLRGFARRILRSHGQGEGLRGDGSDRGAGLGAGGATPRRPTPCRFQRLGDVSAGNDSREPPVVEHERALGAGVRKSEHRVDGAVIRRQDRNPLEGQHPVSDADGAPLVARRPRYVPRRQDSDGAQAVHDRVGDGVVVLRRPPP